MILTCQWEKTRIDLSKGFDNYLKPPTSGINKKKMEVTDQDRLFSTSSGTYQQVHFFPVSSKHLRLCKADFSVHTEPERKETTTTTTTTRTRYHGVRPSIQVKKRSNIPIIRPPFSPLPLKICGYNHGALLFPNAFKPFAIGQLGETFGCAYVAVFDKQCIRGYPIPYRNLLKSRHILPYLQLTTVAHLS